MADVSRNAGPDEVRRRPADMTDAELHAEIEEAANAAEWDRLSPEYDREKEAD